MLLYILMFLFFDVTDFVSAAAAVAAVVINFECIDFVALAAGIDVAAVSTSFVDFVPAIAVVIDDADLR